ncbi:hypothetical protein [Lysobacter enzymogenes]|uniref:hypothetical protein n=1 Tax=Lysobacter enzymogenes TaxID=69 RepID=UPI001442148F|nr:hypothetical protein [Lysobacter enzymogenes]
MTRQIVLITGASCGFGARDGAGHTVYASKPRPRGLDRDEDRDADTPLRAPPLRKVQ